MSQSISGSTLPNAPAPNVADQQNKASERDPRRFPVRLKLAATLVLPISLLLVLAFAQVMDARNDARSVRAQADLANAVTGPGSFLDVLIDERNHTAVYLLDAEDLISSVEPGQYLETRELVDSALGEFEDFIAGSNDEIRTTYQPALDAIESLSAAREAADSEESPRGFQNVAAVQSLFETIAEVTDPLFEANERVSTTITDDNLRHGVAIVDRASRQSNTVSLLTYELAVASLAGDADGVSSTEEIARVASLLRDLRTGEEQIRQNGEGDYQVHVEALFASEHTADFPELVEQALETGGPDLGGLFAAAGDQNAFGYDDLRGAAEDEIEASVDDMTSAANLTQNLVLLVGLAVFALLGMITYAVSRSITRPLRSLTEQAGSMATQRLPQAVAGILETPASQDVVVPELAPVEIRTRDEVADVARALNTVQVSALELAAEQAALRRNISDSFVNLGRRNQTLVGRQLDFITELERHETEPTALANLFRLDHLATRMRRNAESLLVLAGIEPPRKWTEPVRITDVIRAALGEIEDYERALVRGIEPITVVGSVAADVAHLLAELVENALTFSPPNQSVEIRGRRQPAGTTAASSDLHNGDNYTVAIIDMGIGMSADEIERANRRLSGADSFTLTPSKYLGHYVTGMIAARHNITVKLASSPGQGVTATVTLPADLTSDEEVPAVAPLAAPAAESITALARPSQVAVVRREDLQGRGQAALAPAPLAATSRSLQPPPPQPAPVDTPPITTGAYRVGSTEFAIDLGTAPAATPTHPAPGSGGSGGSDGADVRPTPQPMPAAEAPDIDLTSRVQGAQLPAAGVAPVPRTSNPPDRTPSSVQEFLSTFAAGLQEGRTEAARERAVGPPKGDETDES